MAITGLNPHCESNDIFNEDKKIVSPAVKNLKNQKLILKDLFQLTLFLQNQIEIDLI